MGTWFGILHQFSIFLLLMERAKKKKTVIPTLDSFFSSHTYPQLTTYTLILFVICSAINKEITSLNRFLTLLSVIDLRCRIFFLR